MEIFWARKERAPNEAQTLRRLRKCSLPWDQFMQYGNEHDIDEYACHLVGCLCRHLLAFVGYARKYAADYPERLDRASM